MSANNLYKSQTETEADLEDLKADQIENSVVFSTDWTAETISTQLAKGAIDLDPAFQRRDAWTTERKSRFIESIILGLPIPQIVLAEKKGAKGSFIVIDGKQRLLSIQRFTTDDPEKHPFALKGLKLRRDLNGMTYRELKARTSDLLAFENQPIRTVIIRNWQSEDVLYLIFHRLNSESLPLSTQELRQALHPGPFLTFADKYSFHSILLRRVLGRTAPDFRMRDVELLIRLYAFRNFGSEYRGNLKSFLDETCRTLNQRWEIDHNALVDQAVQFEHGISLAFTIFGRPFRKWDGKTFEKSFNRAIFDVIVYYFSLPAVQDSIDPSKFQAILDGFKKLCKEDFEFIRSIESTTKSKSAASTRFTKWAIALSEAIGITVVPLQIGE